MDHYFIGYVLNTNDARKLAGKRDFLMHRIPSIGITYDFNTKFAYLGYMDQTTALLAKDKLNNILEAISNKFGPLTCKYIDYQITGPRTTKRSISLIYNNDILINIIVPFIRKYVDKMLKKTPTIFIPHISLMKIDARYQKDVSLDKIELPISPEFKIDSIDILKGILKIKRYGSPSKYDDMNMEIIDRYYLRGTT